MKYSWLLFDADGTLFDFDRAAARSFADTFTALGLGYDNSYLEIYEGINRRLWEDFEAGRVSQAELRTRRFSDLFAAVGITADPAAFSGRYLQNLAGHTDLIDGAEEVVAALAGQARLMIITNGLREVQRPRFAAAAISRHFADFVISEEVGAAKPDPRIFDAAFARMGHPDRREVLIIGDSPTSDIAGGRDYGIATCWYNPSGRGLPAGIVPHHEISDLRELPAIAAGV